MKKTVKDYITGYSASDIIDKLQDFLKTNKVKDASVCMTERYGEHVMEIFASVPMTEAEIKKEKKRLKEENQKQEQQERELLERLKKKYDSVHEG